MVKIIKLLSALLPACASALVMAHSWDLNKVEQTLKAYPTVRTAFSQERCLTGFSQCLLSSGTALIDRGHGVIWQQDLPFKMTLVITSRGLTQIMPDGSKMQMQSEDNPVMQSVGLVLKGLLEADQKTLSAFFAADLKDDKESFGWILTLSPFAEPVSRLFEKIELKGDEVVHSLKLYDKNGDETAIEFSDHDLKHAVLSEEELALFES